MLSRISLSVRRALSLLLLPLLATAALAGAFGEAAPTAGPDRCAALRGRFAGLHSGAPEAAADGCFSVAEYFGGLRDGVQQVFLDGQGRTSVVDTTTVYGPDDTPHLLRWDELHERSELFDVDEDGVRLVELGRGGRNEGYTQDPLVLAAGASLVVGDRSQVIPAASSAPGTGNRVRTQVDVAGSQRIAVPAGVYDRCLRLELRWTDAETDAVFAEETWWLAPEVGLVKRTGAGPWGTFTHSLMQWSAPGDPGDPVDPDQIPIAEFMPLDVGARWTYVDEADGDREFTREVEEHTVYQGVPVARVRRLDKDDEFELWTLEGMRKMFLRRDDVNGNLDWSDDPVPFSQGEIVKVGDHYDAIPRSYTNPVTGGNFHWMIHVRRLREVTVPAGTFPDCLELRVKNIDTKTGLEVSKFDVYLARGVGVVMQQGRFVTETFKQMLTHFER